jgi:triacylglycerol lipase
MGCVKTHACRHVFRGRVFRSFMTSNRRWLSSTSGSRAGEEKPIDGKSQDQVEKLIKDDFAAFKDKYRTPQYPIVLAHGLMGFDELRLAGQWLPGVQYWRGIKEAMHKNDIEVITTSVPTTGSIKQRAHALVMQLNDKAKGRSVNIVAHSMGGLDARYMISRLHSMHFDIKSLTTIATPHRGSSAADIILREIGVEHLPGLYKLLARLKIDSGAFSQLTRKFMQEEFNPTTPDSPDVRYFSYGASAKPSIFSVFRLSHDLVEVLEGPNDGLVSVASSKWGGDDGYKGTLMGVTHLDLINWTNRLKRLAADLTLMKQNFNAVAFYLGVADMLAEEGL